MDPKKEKKEEKECKMTKLHNVCQEMKISPPVFTFQELVSKSSAKGGVTTWQGQASFLDEVIRGEGNDKKSVKENISVKILTDIEEGKFGGFCVLLYCRLFILLLLRGLRRRPSEGGEEKGTLSDQETK